MRACIKTSDHLYVNAQNALRDKWRCSKCGTNSFCFIQPHPEPFQPDVHVDLSPHFIDLWACEIKAGKATIYQPPRDIKEINMACNAAILRPKGRGRAVDSSSKTPGYAPIIHYNFQSATPPDMPTIFSRPRTPPLVEHQYQVASPIPGYAPKDYADNALKAYMTYLQDIWGNDSTPYLELCKKLQQRHVGVDQLAKPGWVKRLEEEFGCTIGMAERITSEYNTWKESLKGVHSIYILILQCWN